MSHSIKKLEDVLSSPAFQRQLTSEELKRFYITEEKAIFRTIVEDFLMNVLNNPPNPIAVASYYEGEEPSIAMAMTLGGTNFAWSIIGDLQKLSPLKAAEKVFPPAKVEDKSDSSQKKKDEKVQQEKDAEVSGFGSYIYPPVWINNAKERNIEGKILSTKWQRASKVVLSTKFCGKSILITAAGFIGIECNTKEEACNILNKIMLGVVFEGLYAHIVHIPEIGEAKLNFSKETIPSTNFALVSPRMLQMSHMGFQSSLSIHNQKIDIDHMKKILAKAAKLDQGIPSDWIVLFLAGKTHFDNLEYTQCFLMLWLIVEQHINELWDNSINNFNKRRKDKFHNPGYWSVDHSIEILNQSDCISDSQYNMLMEFKKKRNNVVHRIEFIDKQDAGSLEKYVMDMFKSRIP